MRRPGRAAQVEDGMASLVVAQLLFLESENPEKPIFMYINSPGGLITAGMAIYDTMQVRRRPLPPPPGRRVCARVTQGSFWGARAHGRAGHSTCRPLYIRFVWARRRRWVRCCSRAAPLGSARPCRTRGS